MSCFTANPELWTACHQGRTEDALQLLKDGARIEEKGCNWYHSTPLQTAANQASVAMVQLLLKWGADISVRRNTKSILHLAADRWRTIPGDDEKVELMIAYGADVNWVDCKGMTPLHLAAYHGNLGIVQKLIANNASILTRTDNGKTAEDLAALNAYYNVNDEIVALLKAKALAVEKH